MAGTRGGFREARRFVPVLLVQFIGTLGFSIALPFLVFLVTDFGGAPWTYGVVGATYSAFQLFGAPLLGRWSDSVGRRKVLLLSQAGTLAAWLLFLLAFSLPKAAFWHFEGATVTWPLLVVFGARALDGITGGNVSVANAYVADLTIGREATRQRVFGWMGIAASLGFTVGPALGASLAATRFGYGAPVVAAAAISAVATGLCFALPRTVGRCPEGPAPEPGVTKILGQQQRRCDQTPVRLSPNALRTPGVRRLLFATFTLFLAFNLFYAVFPVRASGALHFSAAKLGTFFTVLSFALIVAEGPVLSLASTRLSPRALFTLGMLLLAFAFVLFTRDRLLAVFSGALLFALGNGLSWPTFQARVSDAAPQGAQGAVQGAAASAASLASIAGLVLGGALYGAFGAPVLVASALLFVALALAGQALFGPPEPGAVHGGST